MRTNLRLVFITILLAAVVWSGGPNGASLSKTTKVAMVGAGAGGVAGGVIGHNDAAAKRHMATGGLGEREPIAPDSTEAGRQQSRRIEIPIHVSAALQEEAEHEGGGR